MRVAALAVDLSGDLEDSVNPNISGQLVFLLSTDDVRTNMG